MTFTTLTFLLFLPIVFVSYWALPRQRSRNLVIVVASYFFYGWWDYRFCALMLATSLLDYGVGLGLMRVEEGRRRLLLALSLGANLGVLGFFKYFDFFWENLVAAGQGIGWHLDPFTLRVVLPAGISFYTFQAMSYTIDVYRRELPATRSVVDFLAYISFFPQLVAGPIERATRLLPQFQTLRRFDYDEALAGLRQMGWGFFKKIVLADNLGIVVDAAYRQPDLERGPALAFATICFAFQIYCDFSAYSDIARGTGRLFGITLMRNFAHPYFSQDLREFWQRWHISLSTWFRDYVYVPLGGNRVSRGRRALNVIVTFLLSGLWHGASWTYVAWGALHGLVVALRGSRSSSGRSASRGLARTLGTFVGVCALWVLFRADSLSTAGMIWYKVAFDIWSAAAWAPLGATIGTDPVRVGALIALVVFVIVEWLTREQDFPRLPAWPRPLRWAVYTIFVWTTLALAARSSGQFIYFQF